MSRSAALLFGILGLAAAAAALDGPQPGAAIPAFSVADAAGNTYDNAAFKGKVLVLLFVRPEHETSLKALQEVEKVHEQYPEVGVLAIATKADGLEFFRKLAERTKLEIPVAADPEHRAYAAFGIIVSPTTLIIDGSGKLQYRLPQVYPAFPAQLQAHVQLLLGKITAAQHREQLLTAAVAVNPREEALLSQLALARALLAADQPAAALKLLEKLEGNKTAAVAALLGAAWLKSGRVKEAEAILAPFAEHAALPGDLEVTMSRLDVCQDRLDAATVRLERVADGSRELAEGWYALGQARERAGQMDRAKTCYRRAAETLLRLSGVGLPATPSARNPEPK